MRGESFPFPRERGAHSLVVVSPLPSLPPPALAPSPGAPLIRDSVRGVVRGAGVLALRGLSMPSGTTSTPSRRPPAPDSRWAPPVSAPAPVAAPAAADSSCVATSGTGQAVQGKGWASNNTGKSAERPALWSQQHMLLAMQPQVLHFTGVPWHILLVMPAAAGLYVAKHTQQVMHDMLLRCSQSTLHDVYV